MKISVCPKSFLPLVPDRSRTRCPYESLKAGTHESTTLPIVSNVDRDEKKNKSFSKIPNAKSLLYITNIENKEIIEAYMQSVYSVSLFFFYYLNQLINI